MKLRHGCIIVLLAAISFAALVAPAAPAKPQPSRKPPVLKLQVVHKYLAANRAAILKRPRHKFQLESIQVTLCSLDDLLKKRPLFYDDINDKALKTAIKDARKKLWFVQVPYHSHIGVIVAVDPEKNKVIAHARYIIGE
jgi:hypothetical protein